MNTRQIEVMKLRINPSLKLALIAMIENPDASRRVLSEFMNMDKTQLTATTKRLEGLALISRIRKDDSAEIRYEVRI